MSMDGVRTSISMRRGRTCRLPPAAQPSRLTLRFMTERHLWCGRAACKACGEQLYQQGIAAASLVQVGSRAEARKQQRKAAQGCKQPTRRCASASVAERAWVRLCLRPRGVVSAISIPMDMGRRPKHVYTLTFETTPRGHPPLSLDPGVTVCNRHFTRAATPFRITTQWCGYHTVYMTLGRASRRVWSERCDGGEHCEDSACDVWSYV